LQPRTFLLKLTPTAERKPGSVNRIFEKMGASLPALPQPPDA
jgi:hypothetical protein